MRGVDAELVRPAGEGKEVDEPGAVGSLLTQYEARNGRFAVFDADYLPGSVVGVGQQGKVDSTFVGKGCVALGQDDCFVTLEDVAPLEIGLEPFVHLFVFCQHQ